MKLSECVCLGLLSVTLGCSGGGVSGPPIVPVDGIVTLDGSPVEGATVVFTPKKEGTMSMAMTDAAGKFALRTGAGRKGAAVGEHDVTVKLSIGNEESTNGPTTDDGLAPLMPSEAGVNAPKAPVAKVGWIVPERYSKPGALTATVPAGGLSGHKLELKK